MLKSSLYYIALAFSLCFSTTLFAQNAATSKADSMVLKHQYASAFEVLRGSDPNDQDPDIAISKVNILINYYIKTDSLQRFALKDLTPNQQLFEIRERKSTMPMFSYKPDSVLKKLINQYPKNYKLRKSLGNFYYEAHLLYPDGWLEPDTVMIEQIKSNNLLAYQHKEFDSWSLFGIGYAYLMENDAEAAIPYLEHSIMLNPDYALSHYNLAYAFSGTEQYDKCLTSALRAYGMQRDPEFKAEAAHLVAMAYEALKDDNKALEYYRICDKLVPNDYNTILPMTLVDLQLNDPMYQKHPNDLFAFDPTNAAIYQAVMKAYAENEKEKEFIELMENFKQIYRPNVIVMANVHFHQAIAQYDIDEWVASKLNFEKARSLFRNVFNSSHSVFKVIDSYTNAIRKKKK